MKRYVYVLLATFLPAVATAGKCELTVRRTACQGKEAKAVEPYKGKIEMNFKQIEGDTIASTTISKEAQNAGACKKLADNEKEIVRKGTLKAKEVFAKFDGVKVGTTKATSPCR